MGMDITGFLIMDGDGDQVLADAQGQYLAFDCPGCGHPLLATTLENQRGSDEDHPAKCPDCGGAYFLDPRLSAKKLYIHSVEE